MNPVNDDYWVPLNTTGFNDFHADESSLVGLTEQDIDWRSRGTQ